MVWLVVSAFVGAGQAQERDLSIPSVRAEYVAELAEISRTAKAEAEAFAQSLGIPIRIDDGTKVMELMSIDDGRLMYYVTHNTRAAISTATDLVRYTAPYNVDGSGMTVGVWDGGSVLSTHQEFDSRVDVMDGSVSHYHATHVGGTIGAAGVDADALGMAPNVYIDSYNWDDDNSEMASRGMNYAGESGTIQVSNHSYGFILGWHWGSALPRWYAGKFENGAFEYT